MATSGNRTGATFYEVGCGQNSDVAVGENGTVFQSGVFEDSIVSLANPAWINGRFQVAAKTQVGRELVLRNSRTRLLDRIEERAGKACDSSDQAKKRAAAGLKAFGLVKKDLGKRPKGAPEKLVSG